MGGTSSPWVDTAQEGVPAPARPVGRSTLQNSLSGWQRRCRSVAPIELSGTQPSRTCWNVSSRQPGKAVHEQLCWGRCPATSQVPAARYPGAAAGAAIHTRQLTWEHRLGLGSWDAGKTSLTAGTCREDSLEPGGRVPSSCNVFPEASTDEDCASWRGKIHKGSTFPFADPAVKVNLELTQPNPPVALLSHPPFAQLELLCNHKTTLYSCWQGTGMCLGSGEILALFRKWGVTVPIVIVWITSYMNRSSNSVTWGFLHKLWN